MLPLLCTCTMRPQRRTAFVLDFDKLAVALGTSELAGVACRLSLPRPFALVAEYRRHVWNLVSARRVDINQNRRGCQ